VSPKLFGTSGIRGVVNVEVTSKLALQIGMALASQFDGGLLTLGRDPRLSGEMIELALIAGITSCGSNAQSFQVMPTPVTAYLTRELDADTGVSICASHNPPQYNGLKLFDSSSMAYTEEQQRLLEIRIEKKGFEFSEWDRIGVCETNDAREIYLEGLQDQIQLHKRWNVVCDLFNGATCTIAPRAFEELGCEATQINAQPDGNFPAGEPEPKTESLQRLGRMVNAVGAEIGIGFDGDGDRMIPVDERGRTTNPDRVLAAYAKHLLENRKGGIVVTHVGASMCIDEAVAEGGGSVVRTKVGDVSIAEEMKRSGAVFGGEPVGAWIHPEFHLCPDGLLSAFKLMEALEKEGKKLSEFIASVPEYPILRAKIKCPNHRKAEIMNSISSRFNDTFDVKSASTVDGVRLDLIDGWTLIRPSGTEPVIRITVEAKRRKRAKELMERSSRFVINALEGKI
jgi:phosphoglucosamine mutase